ncbi:Ca2+-binding RTX toxin-like protein [Ensifer mexicanus]|nr:Ca2+-binding RTX toxin-like protein [Sinorhizobium mexicanum]
MTTIIFGSDGNDTLDGGAGDDTIFGQGGDDLIIGGRDSLASRDINNTIDVEDLEDQTESDDGNDTLYGGDGNDTIIGGAGQDYLDGGSGVDTVVYAGSSDGVTIDLANGTANGGDGDGPVQIVGRGAAIRHDMLVGFENAVGSSFDGHLIGNALSNELSGGTGDDTLTGGGGADRLNGGAGSDTADYADATRGVRLSLAEGKSGGDTYTSIENLAGSGFDDRLTGNGAANILTGQGGNDALNGGRGDDTLLGDFAYQGDAPPRPGMGTGYTTLGPDATNNSIAAAFDISNNFSLASDPDIFDSTTILHTTVDATGNGQGGYYKISLAAGTVITIDIDGIVDPNVHDSWVRLLDSAGNIVAQNDDGDGDPGSASNRDSSLVFVAKETGTYYILEGSWLPTAPGDGWAEVVPAGSTYELNVSVEFPPAPAQPGVAGSDTLTGGGGNDLLDGGLAADTLTGGEGEDTFRFSTELGNGNVDWIEDFKVIDDTILLDNLIFENVGGDGALALSAFYGSATGVAHDGDDRIIYDTDSGALSYDADGGGAVAAIQFAQLSTNLRLSAADFIII